MNSFLDALSQVKNIKKYEISLPITKKVANITPLVVGDDLGLRSSITSPAGYDREIVKILHKRIEYVDGVNTFQPNYDDFCNSVSNIDKVVMIWGLYKCTYETLGERVVRCPKCKVDDKPFEFKYNLIIENLLKEDSLNIWDEDVPFQDFLYEIKIEYSDFIYKFITHLPTISHYNKILGLLTTSELQTNLNKIGQVFSKSMQMSLLTKEISLGKKNVEGQISSNKLQDIIIAFEEHIPEKVAEEFYEIYNKKFEKYVPNFYENIKCTNCSFEFKYDVDIETEFFRRSILGRE